MSTVSKLYAVMRAGQLPGETIDVFGQRVLQAAMAADSHGVNVSKFTSIAGGLPVRTEITYDPALTPEEVQAIDNAHEQDCLKTMQKNKAIRQTVIAAILAAASGVTGGASAGAIVATVVPQLLNLISTITKG